MDRRATSVALCAALLLVLTAIPASANPVHRVLDGNGGVIDPGRALVLFQFHLHDDGTAYLDMDVWLGVGSEEEIEGVDPDCHYSGDTVSNPELSYVDLDTSFLMTIDGSADLGCRDAENEYVLAEVGVRAGAGGFLTEPITDGDGSLCRGVRHTTDDAGIARVHVEAQGLEPEVVLDGEGDAGSGFFGSEQWLCLEPGH